MPDPSSFLRHALAAGFLALLAACGPAQDLRRGREALDRNDLEEARTAFGRVLADRPDDPDALYGLGWTSHVAGRREEARLAFERCIQAAPGSPLGFKGLGSVALGEGELVEAEAWFGEALDRAPGDRAVRNSLALVHLKAGRTHEALALYETLRHEDPADAALALGQAQAFVQAARLPEALAVVETALAGRTARARTAGLLHALRARILVALTAGRIEPDRCAGTVPPVLARLDAAAADLEEAAERGVPAEDLLSTSRLLVRRHEEIGAACPGFAIP